MKKYTLFVLLTMMCTVTLAAQHIPQNKQLNQKIDTAVQQARASQQMQPCTCAQEVLDMRELIEAEEELALIRNTQDNHATFEKYPYLLNPVYRRHKGGCPCQSGTATAASAQPTPSEEPLDTRELIEAEEELNVIRNSDINASFDTYPYLLNPKYRRGDEKTRQQIRQDFENYQHKAQTTWGRKVGI